MQEVRVTLFAKQLGDWALSPRDKEALEVRLMVNSEFVDSMEDRVGRKTRQVLETGSVL